MHILSDEQISALISERKAIPNGLCPLEKMSIRNLHKRKDFEFAGDSGSNFTIAVRQSTLNMMDFSVILGYKLPGLFTIFRLRRYNGKSHHHSNTLEGDSIYDFHIHVATQRYQMAGFKEEHYAAATHRYYDLNSAIQCLLDDCGFRAPIEESPLFSGKI